MNARNFATVGIYIAESAILVIESQKIYRKACQTRQAFHIFRERRTQIVHVESHLTYSLVTRCLTAVPGLLHTASVIQITLSTFWDHFPPQLPDMKGNARFYFFALKCDSTHVPGDSVTRPARDNPNSMAVTASAPLL